MCLEFIGRGLLPFHRTAWLPLLLMLLLPIPAHSEVVHQKDYGSAWPLTVTAGDLQCELVSIEKAGRSRPSVTFTPVGGGKRYAVNGAAVSLGRGLPIDELVRKENKGALGNGQALLLPASVQPLIDRGLKLCGAH